jgi:hypothetical protein
LCLGGLNPIGENRCFSFFFFFSTGGAGAGAGAEVGAALAPDAELE